MSGVRRESVSNASRTVVCFAEQNALSLDRMCGCLCVIVCVVFDNNNMPALLAFYYYYYYFNNSFKEDYPVAKLI